MAATTSSFGQESDDHIIRPRAVRPTNSRLLRTMSQEPTLRPNGTGDPIQQSGLSRSGLVHSCLSDTVADGHPVDDQPHFPQMHHHPFK